VSVVGLPLAIDPIPDVMRTAPDVTGQALVPVLVADREGLLDQSVYGGPATPPEREPRFTREPSTRGAPVASGA
jgi:Na+/H+-dicarboxylate symporter